MLDHFETFVFSQDDRLGIADAVGRDSWFVYAFEGASHRRWGRRGTRNPTPRHRLPDLEPRAVERSVQRILDRLMPLVRERLRLVTDDHPAYRRVTGALPAVEHRVHPNPHRGTRIGQDSKRRNREMFAVDLLHRLRRHTEAHHRRETIAFGRRSAGVLERTAHYVVWRNFVKRASERRPGLGTPAVRLGLVARPVTWPEILSRRLFPMRVGVSEAWMRIYRREWTTPAVGRNRRHELKHAF